MSHVDLVVIIYVSRMSVNSQTELSYELTISVLHTIQDHPYWPVSINPFIADLPQHGVPRPGAPRHNIIFNSFF